MFTVGCVNVYCRLCECLLSALSFFYDRPVSRYTWKKLKYFFYIYPDGSDLTKTTTMTTTTMTTMMNSATTAVQAKKMTKTTQPPRRKWSGGEEPIEYRRDDDDEDTGRLTADEQRYLRWYAARARLLWRDDDLDDTPAAVAAVAPAAVAKTTVVPHVPFMNLTKAERYKKSDRFKFGLCSDCDAGLDDESDFVCVPRPRGAFIMTCNACHDYYFQTELVDYPRGAGANSN